MNYLAHLHLADLVNSHLGANLLADFIRGKPEGRFKDEITEGIYLHRFIDRTVDATSEVKDGKQIFPIELRRFSGIALDLYWDHFLAKNWEQFHLQPLPDFIIQAEKELLSFCSPALPAAFLHLQQHMWKQQWLQNYQDPKKVSRAIVKISQRRERLAPLAHCAEYLMTDYDTFEQLFFTLYPKMITEVESRERENK